MGDDKSRMLWLDSASPLSRPIDEPGIQRGLCPINSGDPAETTVTNADATVTYSNIRIGEIGSTTGGQAPAVGSYANYQPMPDAGYQPPNPGYQPVPDQSFVGGCSRLFSIAASVVESGGRSIVPVVALGGVVVAALLVGLFMSARRHRCPGQSDVDR